MTPRRRLALVVLLSVALVPRGVQARESRDSLLAEAREALQAGQPERAAANLETVIAAEPRGVYLAWHLLGQVELLRGRAPAALAAFDEALARAPEFGPARLGRAEAMLAAHRYAEAASVLEGLLSGGGPQPSLRRQAALYLVATAEPPPAERTILLGIDEDLSAASSYAALGIVRLRRGEPESAAAALAAALDLDDRHGLARTLLGRLTGDPPPLSPPAPGLDARIARVSGLLESGARRDAIDRATRILEGRPRHVPARVLRARSHALEGDFWPAIADYETVLDIAGALPTVAEELGRTALAMEAFGLASCALEAAADVEPDDPSVRFLLAMTEKAKGDLDGALAQARRALELGHDPARSWIEIGELLFRRMDVAGAIDAYRRAVEIDPEAAEVIRPFALASLTAEQSTALRELLEDHLEANPENLDTLYALASFALSEGDLDVAESRFRRLVALAPDRPQVHFNLGQILLRKGETEEGRMRMERFRELEEAANRDWERHNRAHARRLEARDALSAGNPGEAAELYRESLREGTATREDELGLAQALLEAGRSSEALETYRGRLGRDPYDEAALEGLARAARESDRPDLRGDAERKLALLRWCGDS